MDTCLVRADALRGGIRYGFKRSLYSLKATHQPPVLTHLSLGYILNAISESIPFGEKNTQPKYVPEHLLSSTEVSLVTSICCFCFSTSLGAEKPGKSSYPAPCLVLSHTSSLLKISCVMCVYLIPLTIRLSTYRGCHLSIYPTCIYSCRSVWNGAHQMFTWCYILGTGVCRLVSIFFSVCSL